MNALSWAVGKAGQSNLWSQSDECTIPRRDAAGRAMFQSFGDFGAGEGLEAELSYYWYSCIIKVRSGLGITASIPPGIAKGLPGIGAASWLWFPQR